MTAHFLYREAQEFLYATRECSELTSREKADIIAALKKIEDICLAATARDEDSRRDRRRGSNYRNICGSSACGSTSRTSTCSSSPRSSGCSSSSSSSGCGSSYGTGSHC